MSVNALIPSESQIQFLLRTIAELEVKTAGPERDTELMKNYQKAVEYYSAIDSPEYVVYLNKIRELMKSKKDLSTS